MLILIPLHTPSLHGGCFMGVLLGVQLFWEQVLVTYSVAYMLIFGCEYLGILNT